MLKHFKNSLAAKFKYLFPFRYSWFRVLLILQSCCLFQLATIAQDPLIVKSEGGGPSEKIAVEKARMKAIIGQIDAIARLKTVKRRSVHKQIFIKAKPDRYILSHEVVKSTNQAGVFRAVVDVELDLPQLIAQLIKLKAGKDFRYKPRVAVAADHPTFSTAVGKFLIGNGFRTVATEMVKPFAAELEEGVAAGRLVEIGKELNADLLLSGKMSAKGAAQSSFLKGSDLQSFIISGSLRVVHFASGEERFSTNFSQAQSAVSLEKAEQGGLTKLLKTGNAKGLARPVLEGLLQQWTAEVAVGSQRTTPNPQASDPPKLSLIAPTDKSVTTSEAVLLRAAAKDDVGIDGIKLWVNGIEVVVKDGEHLVSLSDSKKKKTRSGHSGGHQAYQIQRMTALSMGENAIRMMVTDLDGNATERRLTVNRNPEKEAEVEIEITVSRPANESIIDASSVILSGQAKVAGNASGTRITSVKVWINNKEMPMARDLNLVRKKSNYKIDRSLPLAVGRNTIRLLAETSTGQTQEQFLAVTRQSETRSTPVQIALYSPRDGQRTTQGQADLRGQILGDGTANTTVLLNGQQVATGPQFNQSVDLKMGENIVTVDVTDSQGKTFHQTSTITRVNPSKVPLMVEITSPANGETVAESAIDLTGQTIGAKEAKDVLVTINGVQTRDLKLVRKVKKNQIRKQLHLAPGENQIQIVAVAADGTRSEPYQLTVIRQLANSGTSREDKAAIDDDLSEKYNKYAVIIGIGDYVDPGIPDLTYGSVDAKAIHQKMIDPAAGGVPASNVKALFDQDATLANIRQAIGEWLPKQAKANDLVFMYYSGHGGVMPDESGEEPDGRRKFIIPHDANLEQMDKTALRNNELSLMLDRIAVNKFVFVMDCCFSGGQVKDNTIKSVSPANTPIGTDIYGQLSAAGRVVISASQPDQVSFESAKLKHGIFTYHLLEALKGKADMDTDNMVNLLETYMYVQREVSEAARNLGQVQQPKLMGNISGSIVLSKTQ
ncbi:MAG: caspase family protein [Candidatus Poribacteria bacterium]|nr:caspase family protein [Candidatus Poribacteria bacterium]